MDQSLQSLYFIVGVVGVALSVALAVAAAVYFVRMDIRAVWADLSGKKRLSKLTDGSPGARRRTGKSVLVENMEWRGEIAQGEVKQATDGRSLSVDSMSTKKSPTRAKRARVEASVSTTEGSSFRLLRSEAALPSALFIDDAGAAVPFDAQPGDEGRRV